jgi:hypothetical protein
MYDDCYNSALYSIPLVSTGTMRLIEYEINFSNHHIQSEKEVMIRKLNA